MSSTPLTATVELQSCVEGACVTIEVICRGIYVICFDIIRYMNSSFTPLTLTIGYAHDNNFNSLSMLSLQQNITGIDFSEFKTKVLEWEHFVAALVTTIIYIEIDPVATNVKSVILTDFDDRFQAIIAISVKELQSELRPSKVFSKCSVSLRNLFRQPEFVFTSCIAAFLQLLGGSVHKNVIVADKDLVGITSIFTVFISQFSTVTKRNEFKSLAPPIVIFYFNVISLNEIDEKQKITLQPELVLNLDSIVYELTSIIYISHKQDYVVSFCNDGRNYLYSTIDSSDRCKRQNRPIFFPPLQMYHDIEYYPTLLFYQRKYRVKMLT